MSSPGLDQPTQLTDAITRGITEQCNIIQCIAFLSPTRALARSKCGVAMCRISRGSGITKPNSANSAGTDTFTEFGLRPVGHCQMSGCITWPRAAISSYNRYLGFVYKQLYFRAGSFTTVDALRNHRPAVGILHFTSGVTGLGFVVKVIGVAITKPGLLTTGKLQGRLRARC